MLKLHRSGSRSAARKAPGIGMMILLPLLLGWSAPSLAQSKLADMKKGKELLATCQASASDTQKTYLAGYAMGTADASMGKHLCPKEPVSNQQLVDAFCKYLSAHPKQLNQPAGLLLGLALSEAWPCIKN